MIKLSEEDLAILHQIIHVARETGEEPETVEEAHKILTAIERDTTCGTHTVRGESFGPRLR